ncbi:MAG: hypothetical protein M3P18_01365 [Actinomycetota bacterium]|nr:hypothetical protein [Actinomycetota bacterium]
MNSDDTIRDRLHEELRRHAAPPRQLEPVIRGARRLRIRRIAEAATLVGIVVLGVGVPIVLLSPLGGPATHPPAASPSLGATFPSPSVSAPAALARGTAQNDPHDGVSILTPPGWSFLENPSGPDEPPTLFAVASYPIERSEGCAPMGPLDALPAHGAVAWLLEYHGTQGNDFPPRPDRFSLDPSSLAKYDCSGDHATYMFRFQDQGRDFQVHVAFGGQASRAVRDDMLSSLSSLVVDRCPPAEPPVLLSKFGTLAPDNGRPGDQVTLSGPTGRDENWFWAPLDKIEVWWSRGPIGTPEQTAEQHLLATVTLGTTCSFSMSFRVPNVPPGSYLVTVLGDGSDGFGWMGERRFIVTG